MFKVEEKILQTSLGKFAANPENYLKSSTLIVHEMKCQNMPSTLTELKYEAANF